MSLYSFIRQGRACNLAVEDTIDVDRARGLAERIKTSIGNAGMRISFMDWTPLGQYVMVLQDGSVTANPVENSPGYLLLGNALEQGLDEMWKIYPYKNNHKKFYRDH